MRKWWVGASLLVAAWVVGATRAVPAERPGVADVAVALPVNRSEVAGERVAAALPALHHVQLNTLDAEAAIDWYLGAWPSAERTEFAGMPAVRAEMLLLFREVGTAPPGGFKGELGRSVPQSAFWHIGAFTNTTGLDRRLADLGVLQLPLFTSPDDMDGVWRSGLTPYAGIRTEAQMSRDVEVLPRPGGFGYVLGPDGALIEFTGGPRTQSSFSHVHFFHERPLCAANWYVEHLGMELPPVRGQGGQETPRPAWDPCDVELGEATWPSLERAGTLRQPRGGVRFGNGSMSWYPRQCTGGRCGDDQPLAPSRGQVFDHVAFTVVGLDALYDRLRAAGVTILQTPRPFGETRAFMLQDPDGLAVELLEAREARSPQP